MACSRPFLLSFSRWTFRSSLVLASDLPLRCSIGRLALAALSLRYPSLAWGLADLANPGGLWKRGGNADLSLFRNSHASPTPADQMARFWLCRNIVSQFAGSGSSCSPPLFKQTRLVVSTGRASEPYVCLHLSSCQYWHCSLTLPPLGYRHADQSSAGVWPVDGYPACSLHWPGLWGTGSPGQCHWE